MSVPALRFKQDDGSEFPIWIGKKIGDFVLSHKGGAPLKPADFVKIGNFEVIPKKAISKGGYLKLDETEPTFCSERFFEANQRSVVDNTYLVTTLRDLVPSGPSIGYIVKYNNNKKYILAQGVYGIQIGEKLIDDFLIQYSNTDKYRELMQTMMVGSTQVHIRNSDFFNTPFSVPSLKEQIKIANFLTAVDEKISQLTQKYDLLTQYKKGVMQQIFSQELRFKDVDGGDFPEWEDVTLDKIVKFQNGKGHENIINEDGKYIVINSKFVASNGKVFKCAAKALTPIARDTNVMVMSDVPNGKALGKCFYISEDNRFTLNQRICALKSDKHHNKFLYYLINRNPHFLSFDSGVGQTNLKKEDVLSCSLTIPKSNIEQTKIASFLTAIDDKINSTQSQLQAVKQYKQGLLQQMFV